MIRERNMPSFVDDFDKDELNVRERESAAAGVIGRNGGGRLNGNQMPTRN